jgi:NADPH2:quinone reductase
MMTLTNTSLVGVLAAGYSQEHVEGIFAELTAMLAMGALREAVIETVSFNEVPIALARVAARKTLGKCVVDIRS